MNTVLLFKALHIFFIVAWFAGIFNLPRLFVYHAMTEERSNSAMLKIMERRLLFFVTPFAILTAVFGFALMYIYGIEWIKLSIWLHIKLTLVLLLYIYHGYCFKLLADFKHDRNKRSHRFYRIFNELPVLILLAVIMLAVMKPGF